MEQPHRDVLPTQSSSAAAMGSNTSTTRRSASTPPSGAIGASPNLQAEVVLHPKANNPVIVEEVTSHDLTPQETAAAMSIQKTFREHRARRHAQGLRLTADQRWDDAVNEALYRTRYQPLSRAEREEREGRWFTNSDEERIRALSPSSKVRWARVAHVAKMVQRDDPDVESSSSCDESVYGASDAEDEGNAKKLKKAKKKSKGQRVVVSPEEKQRRKEKLEMRRMERIQHAKVMDMQYFLELVDCKSHWKTCTNEFMLIYYSHSEGTLILLKGQRPS